MTMYLKISVVTPSFNQGHFLEETILSVINQNYPNLEYIIIDGGSTDSSLDIIHKYGHYLTYWASERDSGQSNAINKGFARSTGDILGWLNSDDILLPNALNRINEAFSADPSIKVVTGFRKAYDSASRFLYNVFYGIPNSETLRYVCNVAQETTYWQREVWETVGYLDESLDYAMDYDYWQRMLRVGFSFHILPYYLGGFRLHADSKGSTMNDIRIHELGVIYRRYGIADSEVDALDKLEQTLYKEWRQKMRFMRDLLYQAYFRRSDDPAVVQRFFHLLNTPVLGDLLIWLHKRYSKFRGRYVY